MPYTDPEAKRLSDKAYRERNKDALRERNLQWRLDNPVKCKATYKRYAQSEKGKSSGIKRTRKYGKKNPDKKRHWARLSYRRRYATPEGRLGYHLNRVARRSQMQVSNMPASDRSLIAQVYARAKELRQWFDVVVDHRLPLSKGGPHSSDNLQIIYRKENSSKGNRLDYVPSVVFA